MAQDTTFSVGTDEWLAALKAADAEYVPSRADETATIAIEGSSESVQALPVSEPGHKERFDGTFESMVKGKK
jgi:hypothetical protein